MNKKTLWLIIKLGALFAVVVGAWQGLNYLTDKNSSQLNTVRKVSDHNSDQLAKELLPAWDEILKDTDVDVDIALYSPKTGKAYTLSNVDAKQKFTMASIFKVSAAEYALKQIQDEKLESDEEIEGLLENMIVNSDNDATDYLLTNYFNEFNSVQNLYKKLGLTHTKVNNEHWGLTKTTAIDQLKVLNSVFYGHNDYLNEESRNKLISLMDSVASEQDWGISAGAPAFQLKNGWLDDDDGTWFDNSIGHVYDPNNPDDEYTIAILTKGNSDYGSGIDLVESIAMATNKIIYKK